MVEISPKDPYNVQLEKRIQNQSESIKSLHKKLKEVIDFKSVVKSKICYYRSLEKEADKHDNWCSQKKYKHKLEAMEDLLRYIDYDD